MFGRRVTLLICYAIIIAAHCYYPKWTLSGTENTISWDVSGYYMYLPAIFIYQDVKDLAFAKPLIKKYRPTPNFQQAYLHDSGNHVLKYSCGQAIQYLPGFLVAHAIALMHPSYEADGFSQPYQVGIAVNSLLICFIGLFFLNRILAHYFKPNVVFLAMVSIVLGSNYLSYSAISGAMTHNYLFTIYAVLIFATIRFYQKPTWRLSLLIGLLVGLAALTRPTEIITALIPILWGINPLSWNNVKGRFSFLSKHFTKVILAFFACLLIGSLQFIYWKYATGDWIVYSYQKQGFSWLEPHLWEGMFSFKSGWITYSPIMIIPIIGFLFLVISKPKIGVATLIYSLLFTYIAFSWDIWWYGGSLGQRAMVQLYPILAFSFAGFYAFIIRSKILTYLIGLLLIGFFYLNICFVHQSHHAQMLYVGQMTKAYYWKIFGKFNKNYQDVKLLDSDEYFEGQRANVQTLLFKDFEKDTLKGNCQLFPIEGNQSLCLSKEVQFSPKFVCKNFPKGNKWIRASAKFKCAKKQSDKWLMTQLYIRFFRKDKKIKDNMLRIQRILDDYEMREIYLDASYPKEEFDRVEVSFWNSESQREILIDDLRIESFR